MIGINWLALSAVVAAQVAFLETPATNDRPVDRRAAAVAPADSYQAVIVNRVAIDIAAPAALIWTYLPGVRVRPNVERVARGGPAEGVGSEFDLVYRDPKGTVTRHDRLTVLHWDAGARFVARVEYLPPAPPLLIIYNVDLREAGGSTHFVMDSYTTLMLPRGSDAAAQAADEAGKRREWQTAVDQGYDAMKREIESAVRQR